MNPIGTGSLPADLARHRAYARVFQPGRLTFGFIAPLEGYPESASPTLEGHAALARQADALGFAAIWLRDVPFFDPSFGDVGQIHDPMVYAGWLAAITRHIAIGTAGMVMTLRDPILVAKQAASVDQLSGGRLLLGLSTGDRATEYPAFAQPYDNRAERYREAHALLRVVTEQHFPTHQTVHYGRLDGNLDLVPKPVGRLPTLAIGRCGQDVDWLAQHMDGWIWHQSDFDRLPDVLAQWRASGDGQVFKPYGYGVFFDLDENPDAPLQVGRGIRTGRNALIALWKRQQAQGVSHVALNLKPLRRPAAEVLAELAEYVLPEFPVGVVDTAVQDAGEAPP
ncbi:LLM class oxidoreductase [Burkholderia gladioli]|uniref:LLM class oxidoreductase n=1 Tax=Burkholderia gladioli TaxID=28095 RepID=UPI002FDFCFEA